MLGELVKAKASLTYVTWNCGTGKTTCMVELGHTVGLRTLSSKVKSAKIKLIVANADLVDYYQKAFI